MSAYTKLRLSGSSNGRQIKISQTVTPGNIIHQAISGLVDADEIWLYATNNHVATLALTIEWGGTTNPDDRIQLSIPSKSGLFLIVPGLSLNGSLYVRAFAESANLICISGWVNRITN